jgi:hypothetical protein
MLFSILFSFLSILLIYFPFYFISFDILLLNIVPVDLSFFVPFFLIFMKHRKIHRQEFLLRLEKDFDPILWGSNNKATASTTTLLMLQSETQNSYL